MKVRPLGPLGQAAVRADRLERIGRAVLWWVVLGIWAYVLGVAVPAFAQGSGIRDTGSLVSTHSVAVGEPYPEAPPIATHVCGQQVWEDGPPAVPYTTPWECVPGGTLAPGACYWSGLVTVDGVEYFGHRSGCTVQFWTEAAVPPDPPASSASGVSCGDAACLDVDTFEGWSRIVAAFMVVVVWALGLAHGRAAS